MKSTERRSIFVLDQLREISFADVDISLRNSVNTTTFRLSSMPYLYSETCGLAHR